MSGEWNKDWKFEYEYNICGMKLHICTDRELADRESIFGEQLVKSCENDLHDCKEQNTIEVAVTEVDEILNPEEQQLISKESKNLEYPVWRNGDVITRDTWDLFREKPHMRMSYRLDDCTQIACAIRKEDWAFATTEKYFWPGLMLQYLLIHNRGVIMHSSYVQHQDGAILFIGRSGIGKSTQAKLWEEHRGARTINGDKVGIRLTEEGAVACGVPFSGTSGICENVTLPLKAIVVLAQAPENTIRRMKGIQAVMEIYPNIFVGKDVPEESQMALDIVLEMLNRVPVYALACTPDVRAVECLERVLI